MARVICNSLCASALIALMVWPPHTTTRGNTSDVALVHFVFLAELQKGCTCYFIDSNLGSDTNTGLEASQPWRSLSKLNSVVLVPGTVVALRRESTWNEELRIVYSGTENNPITITAYGSGNDPTIGASPPNAAMPRGVLAHGSWIVIEHLRIANISNAALVLTQQSSHIVVAHSEILQAGIGIQISGSNHIIVDNFIHDLHMVKNTPGGSDDFGAVGVVLDGASSTHVIQNHFRRCKSASFDYGIDGGAVEFFDVGTDHNSVERNWAEDNNGFLEVGGGSASDNLVAYNVMRNNGRAIHLNLVGPSASAISELYLYNNTIIEEAQSSKGWTVLSFNGQPTDSTLRVRNNIFYIDNFYQLSSTGAFIHTTNIYFLIGGTTLGYAAEPSELFANPRFKAVNDGDYHLLQDSPAINAGEDLGLLVDFEGNSVDYLVGPDIGAFEYLPVIGEP